MSKRCVVETLICANCEYFRKGHMFGPSLEYCTFHEYVTNGHLVFCSDFDGQPLLEVGRTPKRVVDTGPSYCVF